MHEEHERPPNEKSHAYHFSISYNGCDVCLKDVTHIYKLMRRSLRIGGSSSVQWLKTSNVFSSFIVC